MPHTTEALSSLMAELGPSHASLLILAHYTQSLVVLCDTDGKLVYLNPAGRKLIGVDKADIYPQRMTDYIVPSQRDMICTGVAAAARDRSVWQAPMQLVNAMTGATIAVQRSTFGIQNAAGKITGYVSVIDRIADADPQTALIKALASCADAGSSTAAVDPAEQLIHDLNNMVAAVLSGFSMIERRSHDPSVQAIAVAGKKAAREGLQIARRLKDIGR